MSINVIFLVLLSSSIGFATYLPKQIDQINAKFPGFVEFIQSPNNRNHHLVISGFNSAPFTRDYVYFIPNYTGSNGTQRLQELNSQNVVWPNEASFSEESMISQSIDPYGGIFVPSGFLVPFKDNGAIHYYPFESADRSVVTKQPPIDLTSRSQATNNWFYHRVKLVDLSADGKNDILTCRTYKPVFGQTKTELVGLVLNKDTLVFEEKLVIEGACDVFFDVADIDSDGRFEIIAAGYFIAKLNLIYSDDLNNSFLTGQVKVKAIDSSGDKFFDVRITQIDVDSSPRRNYELLVTNHQGNSNAIKGALYYYKLVGDNIRTGNWLRTTIYNKFPVLKQGIEQAAPGSAKPIYPLVKDESTSRPYLLVAGDGSEYAYLFEPSPLRQELSYKLVWQQDYKDTVGGFAIADINNDGVNEFAIAIYEKNTCYVYTLVAN